MAQRPVAIRIENLSRHYQMGQDSIAALNGVCMEVAHGEFVALLGSSGSGKSTLLNMIAGLDRPTTGIVRVGDQELGAMNSEQLARHRRNTVGIIFQSFNLMPRMSLEENVELPLRLAEAARAERPARVREALDRVGLSPRRTHRPGELSGGEQQRAAIARALVNRPSILLADEPTGNLDSHNGEQILQLVRDLNTSLQMTVVLVTHERPLAQRFADRIVFLRDGKIALGEDGE